MNKEEIKILMEEIIEEKLAKYIPELYYNSPAYNPPFKEIKSFIINECKLNLSVNILDVIIVEYNNSFTDDYKNIIYLVTNDNINYEDYSKYYKIISKMENDVKLKFPFLKYSEYLLNIQFEQKKYMKGKLENNNYIRKLI